MSTLPAEHFTLQQLANIALGTERLTGANTIVLHSLLNLLLKKLNCQHESVSIDGYEARQMEGILKASTITPIIFNEEHFELNLKRFDNLDALEEQLNAAEIKLEQHLHDVRQYLNELEELVPCCYNKTDYNEICEELCSTLDPDIKHACDMLSQSAFLRRILMLIFQPLIRSYAALDERIRKLEDELCLLMKRIDAKYNVYKHVAELKQDFEWCRLEFETVHDAFLQALHDIQEILDTKVDKYQMLQMKDYVRERYDSIWEQLNKLVSRDKCQRAAVVVLEGGNGGADVAGDAGVEVDGADVEVEVDGTDAAGDVEVAGAGAGAGAHAASLPPAKVATNLCDCGGLHFFEAHETKLLDHIKLIDTKRVQMSLESKGRVKAYVKHL